MLFSFLTRNSGMALSCGVDHALDTICAFTVNATCANGTGQVVFDVDAEPGQPIHLVKYITYHTSRSQQGRRASGAGRADAGSRAETRF